MEKKELTQSIKNCANKLTPDCYDFVANAPVTKLNVHDQVTAQPEVEKMVPGQRSAALRLAPVFALLILALISSVVYSQFFQISSVVGIDVNPSIRIDVNRQNRVIALKNLNADAAPIIDGIGYNQVKLDHVVRAVVGSMYQHGYLQDPESAILVSVESSDVSMAEELESKVVVEVNEFTILDSTQVFSQIVPDMSMHKTSDEHDVSFGILNLATQAQENCPQFTLDELIELPLSSLYQLAFSDTDTVDDSQKPLECGTDSNIESQYFLPLITNPDPTLTPTSADQLPAPTQVHFDGDLDDDSDD
ncbi:MAG: hypothetical protein AAGU15_01650 [Anaerolineaceae bacterium]|jgi:hypothetical protein